MSFRFFNPAFARAISGCLSAALLFCAPQVQAGFIPWEELVRLIRANAGDSVSNADRDRFERPDVAESIDRYFGGTPHERQAMKQLLLDYCCGSASELSRARPMLVQKLIAHVPLGELADASGPVWHEVARRLEPGEVRDQLASWLRSGGMDSVPRAQLERRVSRLTERGLGMFPGYFPELPALLGYLRGAQGDPVPAHLTPLFKDIRAAKWLADNEHAHGKWPVVFEDSSIRMVDGLTDRSGFLELVRESRGEASLALSMAHLRARLENATPAEKSVARGLFAGIPEALGQSARKAGIPHPLFKDLLELSVFHQIPFGQDAEKGVAEYIRALSQGARALEAVPGGLRVYGSELAYMAWLSERSRDKALSPDVIASLENLMLWNARSAQWDPSDLGVLVYSGEILANQANRPQAKGSAFLLARLMEGARAIRGEARTPATRRFLDRFHGLLAAWVEQETASAGPLRGMLKNPEVAAELRRLLDAPEAAAQLRSRNPRLVLQLKGALAEASASAPMPSGGDCVAPNVQALEAQIIPFRRK
jgi:hypothetical protein